MREKLVIIPRRRSMGKKILTIVLFVVTCLLILLTIAMPVIFMIPAILSGLGWYFATYQTDIEYEYTYYDGEFRFAKIRAKRRRKHLGQVMMDDVTIIAPKGDPSVYKYENDQQMNYRDLTSAEAGAKVYEIIFKGDKGMCRYEFEPDEDMLDAVSIKYPRAVKK